jgi:septin family protein
LYVACPRKTAPLLAIGTASAAIANAIRMAVDAADTSYRHTALEEKGVRLKLTLVDTPGFGELVDNSHQCVRFICSRL